MLPMMLADVMMATSVEPWAVLRTAARMNGRNSPILTNMYE